MVLTLYSHRPDTLIRMRGVKTIRTDGLRFHSASSAKSNGTGTRVPESQSSKAGGGSDAQPDLVVQQRLHRRMPQCSLGSHSRGASFSDGAWLMLDSL
jgi:hypothetical protein